MIAKVKHTGNEDEVEEGKKTNKLKTGNYFNTEKASICTHNNTKASAGCMYINSNLRSSPETPSLHPS